MSLSVCLPSQVGDNQEESVRLREATKRLYAQLKEMEKRHQEEREKLQVCFCQMSNMIHFLSSAMTHSAALWLF